MIFQADDKKNIPSWIWILFILIPFCIFIRWLIWWFFCPSEKRTSSLEIDDSRSESIIMPPGKDDFSLLKGIGPKTAAALQRAGILTFQQFALMDPEQLELTLKKYSLPYAKAAFWQKQAALAAAEDWDGLQKLQG